MTFCVSGGRAGVATIVVGPEDSCYICTVNYELWTTGCPLWSRDHRGLNSGCRGCASSVVMMIVDVVTIVALFYCH